MNNSFLFYDLETFGINPQMDRIAQFACIRTNLELEPIEDPVVIYCKIQEDYLPDIEACLLTGITPQETLDKGLSEYEFIKEINKIMLQPDTCVLGYNSLRFDDEFIRNTLYRNFFDPYEREWNNGNSRWDLIDMVRLTHDLRPGNIKWLLNEDNLPSFKLDDLAKVNKMTDEHSHDALVDVKNTIFLARLIKENNPKLFEYCYEHRTKKQLQEMLNSNNDKVFIHTSRMLTSEYGCTSIIMPLLIHPNMENYLLCYDIRYNPELLITASTEEVKKYLFISKDHESFKNRIHIKGIYLNKSPIIAPVSVLDEESYDRLHISREQCRKHYKMIIDNLEVINNKLQFIYDEPKEYINDMLDPELQIYSGFPSQHDKNLFSKIHFTEPEELKEIYNKFDDFKYNELLWRFVCRNFPETMDDKDKNRWQEYCIAKLSLVDYEQQLQSIRNNENLNIVDKLIKYVRSKR